MVVALVLLVAFIVAGVSFGFMQSLLIVAIAASMAMLSAFVVVASSRDAH